MPAVCVLVCDGHIFCFVLLVCLYCIVISYWNSVTKDNLTGFLYRTYVTTSEQFTTEIFFATNSESTSLFKMPKKPPKNAFFFYMLHFKEQEAKRGHYYGALPEVSSAASDSWKVSDKELVFVVRIWVKIGK